MAPSRPLSLMRLRSPQPPPMKMTMTVGSVCVRVSRGTRRYPLARSSCVATVGSMSAHRQFISVIKRCGPPRRSGTHGRAHLLSVCGWLAVSRRASVRAQLDCESFRCNFEAEFSRRGGISGAVGQIRLAMEATHATGSLRAAVQREGQRNDYFLASLVATQLENCCHVRAVAAGSVRVLRAASELASGGEKFKCQIQKPTGQNR